MFLCLDCNKALLVTKAATVTKFIELLLLSSQSCVQLNNMLMYKSKNRVVKC